MSGKCDVLICAITLFIRRRCRLLHTLFTAFFLVLLSFNAAVATPVQNVESTSFQVGLVGDQMTVRELMQIDAAQALEQNRARRAGRASVSTLQEGTAVVALPQSTARPALKAIYGVGQRLLAEVQWQGRTYVYLKGHALPVGRKAEKNIYALRSIAARCVILRRDDAEIELCLDSTVKGG